MSKRTPVPKLKIAPRVTGKDAEVFAQVFLSRAWDTSSGFDALADTKLVRWPALHGRFPAWALSRHRESGSRATTFSELRPAVVDAFGKVARTVLARATSWMTGGPVPVGAPMSTELKEYACRSDTRGRQKSHKSGCHEDLRF